MDIRLRVLRHGRPSRRALRGGKAVFSYLRRRARGLDRECLWRIDLDSRMRPLGCELVSIGTLDASLAHPREIFKGALLNNAWKVVVAHNHPSQDPRPSAQDRELTRRLELCGQLLGVELADHVILTEDLYFSFREAGLMEPGWGH